MMMMFCCASLVASRVEDGTRMRNGSLRGRYNEMKLTCPLSSSWLLVSFSLSNETTCFVHCEPLAGESGWTWILGGELGSDLPATTQLELQWCVKNSNKLISPFSYFILHPFPKLITTAAIIYCIRIIGLIAISEVGFGLRKNCD